MTVERSSLWWSALIALLTVLGAHPALAQSSSSSGLDPRAAKARNVLETHCARCHEASALKRPAPAANLGHILDLDRLAADTHLVTPGNADASLLYSMMERREMPFDVAHGLAREETPTAAEIEALRDWIEALTPRDAVCEPQPQVSATTIAAAVQDALEKAGSRARDLRFLSLAHLHNACVEAPRLSAYRTAVTKLLNSLSSRPEPVRPDSLGPEGLLLAFSLADLGWTAAQWQTLTAGTPPLPPLMMPDEVARRLGSKRAVMPADWLAVRATRGSFYADLLAIPAKLDELSRKLGIDRAELARVGHIKRIGLRGSTVTRGMRMIEHLPRGDSAVWLAYDFAGTDGRRDIFANPQGPASANEASGFKPDAVRVLWRLPNGFPAFAVFDGEGQRLDAVPAEVEVAKTQGRRGAAAAIGCMACHDGGARPAVDEMRAHASATDSPMPRAARDAVRSLHPPAEEWGPLFEAEQKRTSDAYARAGLEAGTKVGGVEIVAALGQEHARPVTVARAAAELGLSADALRASLMQAPDGQRLSAIRLSQGSLPRSEAMQLYAGLAPLKAPLPDAPETTTVADAASPDLALVADRPSYKVGDLATFTVRSTTDCYLTLISINTAGKATVIYPNDFEQDNMLPAGRALTIPGEKSPYQLRFIHTGLERMVAICMAQSKMAAGIQQDYEKQRFTALGDWRNFVRSMLEAEEPDAPKPTEKPDTRSRGRASRGNKEAEPARRTLLEPQARAAITIPVH